MLCRIDHAMARTPSHGRKSIQTTARIHPAMSFITLPSCCAQCWPWLTCSCGLLLLHSLILGHWPYGVVFGLLPVM
jgi:hypothetical protein